MQHLEAERTGRSRPTAEVTVPAGSDRGERQGAAKGKRGAQAISSRGRPCPNPQAKGHRVTRLRW